MTDIVLLSKDELAAIIDKRLDFAFTRHRRMFDSIGQGTNQTGLDTKVLNENLNDVFDELNKVKRELTSLKDYIKLLSKEIDALNFAVRRNQQDTICKADVPDGIVKFGASPGTGTAGSSATSGAIKIKYE